METDRSELCGCKGIRTCLKCEKLFDLKCKSATVPDKDKPSYTYCSKCDKCWPGWDVADNPHTKHSGEPVSLQGVYVEEDFLTEREEEELMNALDAIPWDLSQSGRRKQNFGPKCNFKKRKLKVGSFNGFPLSTKIVQDKFQDVPLLFNFLTIEQCSLEYDPGRGASIDPHIDDCWIWGERIITVNLLSDSILTLSPYCGDVKKYNLDLVSQKYMKNSKDDIIIRIFMPRRSLIVLTDEARYSWEHQVYRCDIIKRRVCLAYREFTEPYLPGGQYENEGEDIIMKAKNFW